MDKETQPKLLRVLTVGGVQGEYDFLSDKIVVANSKAGPFELVVCVGDFFPPAPTKHSFEIWSLSQAKLSSKINEAGVHVYILGPTTEEQVKFYQPNGKQTPATTSELESGFEIIDGLTYLGRSGVLKLACGLNIVYLSGRQSDQVTDWTFDAQISNRLIERINGEPVDILLTGEFPRAVMRHAEMEHNHELMELNQSGSIEVARLSFNLKPRYHFCGHPTLQIDRLPYRNYRVPIEQPRPVTRFVCLASLTNPANRKRMYAFFLKSWQETPPSELNDQPLNSTENPYLHLDAYISFLTGQSKPFNNFFFDTKGSNQFNQFNQSRSNDNQGGKKRKYSDSQGNHPIPVSSFGDKRVSKNSPSGSCWFCLASPDVDKQLIVSIGDHNYMALAKGGLVDEHFMIMPISHCRNLLEIKENSDEVLKEHEQFKKALKDYWATKKQIPMFFERNFRSQHAQLHAIPIPELSESAVVNCFEQMAKEKRMRINKVEKDKHLKDTVESGIPYFYLEVGDYKFFVRIRAGGDFPLQFGRELAAHPQVLNLPSRIDWRNCVQDSEEIKQLAQDIRQRFQPFDFTV